MSRRQNLVSGWTFSVSPSTVVDRTQRGGYTVDLKTGQEPKTGTMVSIPGHEEPVPMSKFSEKDVEGYVTPERKKVLSQEEMHLGTWRSGADENIGDAAYLDISKRFPDTGEGARMARQSAMSGDQWALYNIDRNKFESNITKPDVVEKIRTEQKIDIPKEEIQEYAESTNPIGEHLALGFRTEKDVIRTRTGRKKTVAGPGQMTFVELGQKAD
jgi:hypothetical protein